MQGCSCCWPIFCRQAGYCLEERGLGPGASIEQILVLCRNEVLPRWIDLVLNGCPSARRLPREPSEPYANPVVWIVREALADVYDQLSNGGAATASGPLRRLMRLRALDGPDAAAAVTCLAALKPLLREVIPEAWATHSRLSAIDGRVDALTDVALQQFADSRSLLARIRQREAGRAGPYRWRGSNQPPSAPEEGSWHT